MTREEIEFQKERIKKATELENIISKLEGAREALYKNATGDLLMYSLAMAFNTSDEDTKESVIQSLIEQLTERIIEATRELKDL